MSSEVYWAQLANFSSSSRPPTVLATYPSGFFRRMCDLSYPVPQYPIDILCDLGEMKTLFKTCYFRSSVRTWTDRHDVR